MTKRILKIGYSTRTNKPTKMKRETKFLPQVVLTGNWFEQLGFTIGEYVTITAADGLVHIIKSKGGNNAA